MEGIPIVAGIVIFACGFFAGFFWGTRFGGKSESTRVVGEAAVSNFTPRAQQVLALAHKEAERLNNNFVGTEHLFLGLIKLDPSVGSVAVNVLRKMGLDFDKLQIEVERLVATAPDQKMIGIGPDEKIAGNIPYTPRVKRALMLAAKEAKALKHSYVGTEHILLGLLREDGVVPRVLKSMNVDVERTRVEILKELDPNFGSESKEFIGGVVMDNFSPRVQQVLALARNEAGRLNHNFVGTEHVLLGLISLGQGVAVNVLKKMGVDLQLLRMEVERFVGPGPDQKIVGNIPFTPRVKKALSLATAEAKALNHVRVGTEHVLLGLLREGDGVAARVLKNMNVNVEQTRVEILKELDPNIGR